MKRLLSCFMLFCMMASLPSTALAANGENTSVTTEEKMNSFSNQYDVSSIDFTVDDIFKIASMYIDAPDSLQFDAAQPLYNFADCTVAYMFYLNPDGYIIADDHGRVLEYNLEGNHRFFTDVNEHYYYAGITSYYKRDGYEIIDLISGSPISLNANNVNGIDLDNLDLDYSSDSFWKPGSPELLSDISTVSATAAATQYNLKHATRMYNCNDSRNWSYFGVPEDNKGVCGSTALAIMTAYLDDYHTDSTHNWCLDSKKTAYSSSSYEYGKELVKEILGYIEPNGGGTNFLGPYTFYLQDHGIWDRQLVVALTESNSWNQAKASIQRDYPCIVRTHSPFSGVYNDYNEHFMTVVSVSTTSTGTKYYHVNCGWGSSGGNHNGYDKLNANGTNIGEVFYLENC